MRLIANNYEPNEILKIIREWTEMTQKEFAKTVNKSTRTIQDYEAGITQYSMDTLMYIAQKHNLKITIEKIK